MGADRRKNWGRRGGRGVLRTGSIPGSQGWRLCTQSKQTSAREVGQERMGFRGWVTPNQLRAKTHVRSAA